MRIDNKREWKAEGGRVSHEEEGRGDAERRRQMKRPGRRRRARREGRGPENAERAQAGGPANPNVERNRVTSGATGGNDQCGPR